MLVFKGVQKTTLIDFPGEVACTVFLPKCNFRCPFCHNAQLVLNKETGVSISEAAFFDFLRERKNFLDGICITGGEPLLYDELLPFCKRLKEQGFLVKLDTNGSRPGLLQKMLKEKVIDYIAMDIKGSKHSYSRAAGVAVDLDRIQQSIDLVRESGVQYEFRMTVVPLLHKKQDLLSVGKWLLGSKQFFLQQFNSTGPLLDKKFEGSKTYSAKQLQQFAAALKPFFEQVNVRGI